MDYIRSLQLLAMRAVLDPDSDPDYVYRDICRWYSKTFFTPLLDVEDLPVEEVLRTYYEVTYEEMTESERDDALQTLLESEADKAARLRARDAERVEAREFATFTAEEEKKKEAAKKLSDLGIERVKPLAPASRVPESTPLTDVVRLQPDVAMHFFESDSLEEELRPHEPLLSSKKSP